MPTPKGAKPWNAGKGKGWLTAKGYREIRIEGRTVREHRHVMEQHIGRKLDDEAYVTETMRLARGED